MPKTKREALKATAKPRRKNPPKTAYTKENPSPHAFKPGQSGNPGGRVRHDYDRLMTRALQADAASRAPDAYCDQAGVPHHSSYAQVLARVWLRRSASDVAFAQLVMAYLEGPPKQHIELDTNLNGEGAGLISINFVAPQTSPDLPGATFVETDHAGVSRTIVDGKVIDVQPASSRLLEAKVPIVSSEPEQADSLPVTPTPVHAPVKEHPYNIAMNRFHRRK